VQRWFKKYWVGAYSLFSVLLLAGVLLASPAVSAKGPALEAVSGGIALADLPKQGRETYALILAGGPFPYEKDGTVFDYCLRKSVAFIANTRSKRPTPAIAEPNGLSAAAANP
jgi:hypothetical protein